MSAALHHAIKLTILEAVGLEDVRPEQIEDGAPLFGDELLELDSVDALEIVVALQRRFGVHFDDQNRAREILGTVDSIAAFIEAQGAS